MSGDNNKLIVEFMGDEKFWQMLKRLNGVYPNFNGTYFQSGDDRTIGNPLKEEHVLKHVAGFHFSWDWLMPVIHKILQDNDGIKFFNFSANISHALFNNNINNAYKAVVEFIKEYNQNN